MLNWSRRAVVLAVLSALPLGAEIRTLTILHTNDLHSRLSPLDNHHGGFAFLAAAIRHEREGCTDCILLNAGDLAQGSPVSTIYKGVPVFAIANMFGFDAATLGNHDFDYGWQQARAFVDMSKYPTVSSNVVDSKGQLLTPKPWAEKSCGWRGSRTPGPCSFRSMSTCWSSASKCRRRASRDRRLLIR